MGEWLNLLGVTPVAPGLVLHHAPRRSNGSSRLPGNVRLQGERGRLSLRVPSTVVVSPVSTGLVHPFRR